MMIDKDTQGAATATVTVGDVVFGGQRLVLIAGPCTVEDRTQMIEIINKVTGGLDKPDTGICFALPTTFVEGVNKNK